MEEFGPGLEYTLEGNIPAGLSYSFMLKCNDQIIWGLFKASFLLDSKTVKKVSIASLRSSTAVVTWRVIKWTTSIYAEKNTLISRHFYIWGENRICDGETYKSLVDIP